MTPQDALEAVLRALHDGETRAESLAAIEALSVIGETLFRGHPYAVDVARAVVDSDCLDHSGMCTCDPEYTHEPAVELKTRLAFALRLSFRELMQLPTHERVKKQFRMLMDIAEPGGELE